MQRPSFRSPLLVRAAFLCVSLTVGCTDGGSGSTSSGTSGNGSSGTGSSGSSGQGSTSSSSSSGGSSGQVMLDCNSPGGATTLCDIQNNASPNHPSPGTEVTFPDPLTATSDVFVLSSNSMGTTKAFFVAEGNGGPFRAALVKGEGTQVDALGVVLGGLINLTVKADEFQGTGTGTETQLTLVGGTVVPGTGTVPPATVATVTQFGSDLIGEAYEGVLVRVENVTTVRFESGARTEFGVFKLNGGLHVDDLLYKYDAGVGETFSSITGFVRYGFDGRWLLLPRTAADVVSSGNPLAAANHPVTDLQDPLKALELPHCIAPAECDLVRLQNVVVTTMPRVADRNAAGVASLYSVFVQDPTALDANGEPLPYSGVKIVFGNTLTSSYALTTYGDQGFPDTRDHPEAWPMPGDIITVEGTVQEYFDMTQLGSMRVLTKVGTVMDNPLPIPAVPLAKSFGADTSAGLASGRPGVADCSSLDPIPAGADVEKWEGVLVKLLGLTTTQACVPTSTNSTSAPACATQDFGYFKVTGGVEIGTGQGVFFAGRCPTGSVCTCEGPARVPDDTRVLGKVYTSITGVLDYSFSVFRVSPRTNADVVAAP
jgi:hypothetical protein